MSNIATRTNTYLTLTSCAQTSRAVAINNNASTTIPVIDTSAKPSYSHTLDALEALLQAQGDTPSQQPRTPLWLNSIVQNAIVAAAVEYGVARTCSSTSDLDAPVSPALNLLHALECAGLTATLLRPTLISALTAATDARVYSLLAAQDGALDVAILAPALAWARDEAVPFAAYALFGLEDLAACARTSATARPLTNDSPSNYLESALLTAGVLASPAARLPHAAVPLCFTPFTQIDYGSNSPSLLNSPLHVSKDAVATSAVTLDLSARIIALRECIEAIFAGVHASVARARTEQAFDIVRDFPDSAPAVGDLRDAVSAAGEGAAAVLVETLVLALRARLLHAGVATASILEVFLSTVRMLWRVEGNGGVIASLVAEPIQSYLRTRADAIRCIVSSLTEDPSSELYAELVGRGKSGGGRIVDGGGEKVTGGGGGYDSAGSGGDDDDLDDTAAGDNNDEEDVLIGGGDDEGLASELNADCAVADELLNLNASTATTATTTTSSAIKTATAVTRESALLTLRFTRLLFAPKHWRVLQGDPRARGPSVLQGGSTGSGSGSSSSGHQDAASCWGLRSLTGGEPPWWLSSVSFDSDVIASSSSSSSSKHRLWQPSPIFSDATRLRGGRSGGSAGGTPDLLSLLLNIYGSADLFIAEYRSLLSERLAGTGVSTTTSNGGGSTPGSWDITNEERTVELLKLRFGEPALASAEVMLKDVGDSKRIATASSGGFTKRRAEEMASNTAAAATAESGRLEGPAWNVDVCSGGHFEALVLSSHYWPPGALPRETTLEMHPALVGTFAAVAREYTDLKKPRTISAVTALGCIDIQVTLPGDPPSVILATGTPHQVSFLLFWADAGGGIVPLRNLATALHTSCAIALRLASHWVSKNICTLQRNGDGNDDYNVCAVLQGDAHQNPYREETGIDLDADALTAPAIPSEAVEVWNSYVFGMLTNLGPLPLERIQMTLKMFASMGDYPCAYISISKLHKVQ